jgi:integrase
LNIPSKKNRNGTIKVNPVVVKIAGRFLKELQEQQTKFNIKSKWVFPSPQDPNKNASNNVNRWFNSLCLRVLGRSGNNYLLRHSKGTELQKKVREGTLSKDNAVSFMRHSPEMFDKVYSHMDKDDIKQLIKKQIYNTQELTKEEKDEIKKLQEENKEIKDKLNYLQEMFEEYRTETRKLTDDILSSENLKKQNGI